MRSGRPALRRIRGRCLGELDRLAVLGAVAPEVRHREPFGRGIGERAIGRERPHGRLACRERGLTLAVQLVDGAEPALGLGEVQALTLRAADPCELAPGLDGLGEVARQLRAAGVALEQVDPRIGILAAGPGLERRAAGGGGIAVRVNGLGLGGRPDERGAGLDLVAGAQPMGGDLDALAPGRFEQVRDLAVQCPPPQPGDVGVERLAAERVAEGTASTRLLAQPAVPDELGDAGVGRELPDDLEIEGLAGDRGGLRRSAGLVGEPAGAHQHRVAHGVGHGHLVATEVEAARAGL